MLVEIIGPAEDREAAQRVLDDFMSVCVNAFGRRVSSLQLINGDGPMNVAFGIRHLQNELDVQDALRNVRTFVEIHMNEHASVVAFHWR